MILDHLSRAEKYYTVHPSFRHAFEYLKHANLRLLPLGKTEIEGDDIFIIIAKDEAGSERKKLETHTRYIDIQLAIDGSFPLEWHDVDSCKNIAAEYNHDNDVELYNDPPLFTVQLVSDLFAVLFPEDAHAAQPPQSSVLKAIIKVAV